jgi:hypothetical protein
MEGQEPADEGPARYPAYLVRRVRLHNLRSHPLDDLDDLHLSPLSNDSQEEQEERGEQEGAVIVLPANGAQKILHAHTNGERGRPEPVPICLPGRGRGRDLMARTTHQCAVLDQGLQGFARCICRSEGKWSHEVGRTLL